jgi:transposase
MTARLRSEPTLEDLREIAAVWEEANVPGGAPTAAVAEDYGVSASTASRWVRRARALGLVGSYRPRFGART